MKKILPILLFLLIIFAVVVPYSYSGNANSSFFKVLNSEIEAGETLEMTINLDKVNYNNSKFTLTTDLDVSKIYTTDENVKLEEAEDSINISINKDELNLAKIILYYDTSEDEQTGNKYTINALIVNRENEEESLNSNITVTIKDNTDENQNDKDDSKIINKDDEEKDNKDSNKNNDQMNNNLDNKDNQKLNNNNQTQPMQGQEENKNKGVQLSGNTTKSIIAGSEETVTYNGSDNNYLSSLSVEGYTLNKNFYKEGLTYFINTESKVTSLNITATAEETSATVSISGESNLKSGMNKVLISVTSESGQVRIYRIYVTQQ